MHSSEEYKNMTKAQEKLTNVCQNPATQKTSRKKPKNHDGIY